MSPYPEPCLHRRADPALHRIRRVRFFILLFLLLPSACLDSDATGPEVREDLSVGALLALTGDYGATGPANLAALNCALADTKAELAASDPSLRLSVGDTKSMALGASILLDSYLLQGVPVVVGPYTSAEVEAVRETIRNSDALLISPSSTAMTLAEEDDHIFRLAPPDSRLVAELVDLIWARGQRFLALVHRDDAWGNSVAEEMETQFAQKGGTVLSTRAYGPLRSDILAEILQEVEEDIAAAGPPDDDQVAIHLASLDEGSLLLRVAMDSVPDLRLHRWYGTDGFVQDSYLVSDVDLAGFAEDVGYTAPIFRADPAQEMEEVMACIEEGAGTAPGAYTLLTYDAFRLAARALLEAGQAPSYAELESAFLDALEGYQGLSGPVTLDANGDRAGGAYDFFTVVGNGGGFEWVKLDENSG